MVFDAERSKQEGAVGSAVGEGASRQESALR